MSLPSLLVSVKQLNFCISVSLHSVHRLKVLNVRSIENCSKKRVEKSGHKLEIIFHGNINSFKQIGTIMRQSDWLVIPSLSDSIPLVFSEAMKCSLPVIVSDLSDLKHLVEHHRIGLVFKTGSVNSLASLLGKLPLLMDKRKYFVNNTSEVALNFSIEESAKKLSNLLAAI